MHTGTNNFLLSSSYSHAAENKSDDLIRVAAVGDQGDAGAKDNMANRSSLLVLSSSKEEEEEDDDNRTQQSLNNGRMSTG